MFWFSGIVGGAWLYLFPWMGLLGIRLAGVLVSTATIIVTYKLLKKHLNDAYLKLGLLMVTISINNNPKSLYYNNLSAFLYILTAYFLFLGLKEKKYWKIFLAGLFVSLNMFNRLPNVLGVMIGLAILYYGYLNKTNFKTQVRQALYFAGGFFVTTALVFGVMKLIGHYDIFINSIKLVSQMGKGQAESSYGISHLLRINLGSYKKALYYIVSISLFILVVVITMNFIKARFKIKFATTILKYIIFVALIILIARGVLISNIELLYVLSGFTLIAALAIFFINKDNDVKTLMFIGCFILLVHPFGSAAGIVTVGIYSLWIAFPIAINFVFNVKTITINNQVSFLKEIPESSALIFINHEQFTRVKKYGLIVFGFTSLLHVFYYPYFDEANRVKMHYPVSNSHLTGIYTTKGRADTINQLLSVSPKYVKPGDYVMAYDCIPMFNYLTDTKPYIRNPWPWLYESSTFRNELNNSLDETKTLPVIIMQKVKTIGSGSGWPDRLAQDTVEWSEMNQNRNAVFNEFINTYKYHEVWSNACFSILVPDKSMGITIK
ncbi:MAG: glycosyltransferase family 39 protein [Bacteroidetes bacterium]|nr:glycosyltransferase family 39 protein [Bacteroidota bacterium]